MQKLEGSLVEHFITVTDLRQDNKAHLLIDILVIAICGTIGGADGWTEIANFGRSRKRWFKTFLELPNGIPSHDTFGRVFSVLDPKEFQTSFSSWMRSVVRMTDGEVIAIDGKTSRRTGGSFKNKDTVKPLHLVSAFATANGVALGQVATDKKSNEITAIPELLKLLDIRGCIITTDAMGCQADVAADILSRGGDYLLAVKGNQGLLYRDIKACFIDEEILRAVDRNITENQGRGRHEKRVCDVLSGKDVIGKLRHKNNWTGLHTIVRVTATRTTITTGECSEHTRYYIGSLTAPSAERLQSAVRAHWSIENNLHWVLDTAMHEDESRIRTDNAPANMAVLRHIALNLIRSDKTRKFGVKASIKNAGWDTKYLWKLLKGL